MSDKLFLRSRLSVYGAFWRPENPEVKFTGLLARNGKHIELTTSPIYKDSLDDNDFSVDFWKRENVDVLHGFTPIGPCSLLWLQSSSEEGLTELRVGKALTYRQYRVGLCVVGHHVPSPGAEYFNSAEFSYSGLREWIPIRPQITETADSVSIAYRREPTTVFDLPLTALGSRFQLDIVPHLTRNFTGEYKTKHEPRLSIETAEPRAIEWFLKLAYRFENLFSLLLGTSVKLTSVGLTKETAISWVVKKLDSRPEDIKRGYFVVCDGTKLAAAVVSWLSTPQKFESLENLIYGTIRESSLFVETEFLSLAQALESFHRVTDDTTPTAPRASAEIFASVIRAIDNSCNTEVELGNRLKDSIQHANEWNFHMRIDSLLSRLTEEKKNKLLGDSNDFKLTLKQTRNHLTHPGIKKMGHVLTGTRDLFLFSQKLHALLRLLMLMHIGFREEDVFDPIYAQSTNWS